jgi:hypothetical protein
MASQGTTPRGLHTHAVAFSAAAEAVHASKLSDPLPKYFLWGRTIELALKSFLLAEGQPAKKLKQLGHDLDALLHAAKERGISGLIGLDSIYCAIIQILNWDYLSKLFEYRETGATYLLPDLTLTRQLVKRLLKGVDFHLKTSHDSYPASRGRLTAPSSETIARF